MHRQHTPDLSIPPSCTQRWLQVAYEYAGCAALGIGFALLAFIGWSM